jgi:hypothetical protein
VISCTFKCICHVSVILLPPPSNGSCLISIPTGTQSRTKILEGGLDSTSAFGVCGGREQFYGGVNGRELNIYQNLGAWIKAPLLK